MKLTLKNVKVAQFASEETTCFEATVYVDGKKFCRVSNAGKGGPNEYDPITFAERDSFSGLYAKMREYGAQIDPKATDTHQEAEAENEARGLTTEALGWDEWQKAYEQGRIVQTKEATFDAAVDHALTRYLNEKDLKRAMKNRILFLRDGAIMQTGTLNPAQVRTMKNPHWLEQAAKNLKAEKVLNALPLDDALDLYMRYA